MCSINHMISYLRLGIPSCLITSAEVPSALTQPLRGYLVLPTRLSIVGLLCRILFCPTQMAVSFLTTRVQSPNEDDWEKLKRILKYLNGTRNLKLMLCADQTKYAVHWYVDGSHQIHEDCRGQTSSLATFGNGAVSSSLNKMKCNTNSTETELIFFANILTDIIWMHYFVECQGYDINNYAVFQDNTCALLLEKNGRMSLSHQCTKHIKALYFLIKDYYDAGVIDVKFCPTDQMWANVLTKPLQGQKFREMQAFLQNCP
jgi:hypothetical protein